jgi:hypothetical protein
MEDADKAGWGIKEWCGAAGFSVALYFKRQKLGCGPRLVHVNRRTIITEAPRDYLKRLELEAASAQPR